MAAVQSGVLTHLGQRRVVLIFRCHYSCSGVISCAGLMVRLCKDRYVVLTENKSHAGSSILGAEVTFHVLGAFDRFNYGDLLFSRIVDDLLAMKSVNSDRKYYSVSRSDMRKYGGVETVPIGSLDRNSVASNDVFYVAGGDVLTADWVTIIGHSSGYLYFNILRAIRKLFGHGASSTIARMIYGTDISYPFIFSPDDFSAQPKVIYNAVGGSVFLDKTRRASLSKVVQKLTAATSISVRDAQTFAYLKEQGVAVKLRPDSASCMSLIYDQQFLSNHLPPQLSGGSKYVVVQCALHVGKDEIENVVRRARTMSEKLGAKIVLLPIGTAPAHDDDKLLKVIEARFAEAKVDVVLLPQMHIFQIMATLAKASAYAGSSLHGAITSLSYGVPAAELVPSRVSKLTAYLDTWAVSAFDIGELVFHNARPVDGDESTLTQPEQALADLKAHLEIR